MIEYDNKNWLKLLFTFKGSIIPRIAPRLLIFIVIAGILSYLHVEKIINLKLAPTPWTIVGVALGLLLVFRTNTAYDRFWEGRKSWGGLVNATRNMAVNVISYMSSDHAESLKTKEKIIKLLIVFAKLMKQRLREEKQFSEVETYLDKKELEILNKSVHPPVSVIAMIAKQLYKAYKLGMVAVQHVAIMNNNLNNLMNELGACERIRYTPVPIAYVLHLKRFLYLFCLTLPISLIDSFGYWSIAIVTLVAYAFIGIEEIGVEIEDPFGDDPNDLPLDQICDNIEKLVFDIYRNQNEL